ASTENWWALVAGDYETVMPLTWRKKNLFSYLFQPLWCQQLGLFSSEPINAALSAAFVRKAKEYFSFGEICLNYGNPLPGSRHRNNYTLDLNRNYATISKQYNENLGRNLKKAAERELRYDQSIAYADSIDFFRANYEHRINSKENDWLTLNAICQTLQQRNQLLVRAAIADNQVVGSCLVLRDNKRLYLLVIATNEKGKTVSASHFIIDQLIQEFQSQPLLLDFEGSDLPGIERFYGGFGASNQPYFFYGWNQLPIPFRWWKPRYL
nr:GNAT family N-acetyltransferase [Flavihumibacter sp.]